MKIIDGFKEVGAFITATLLSCGPSQLFGVIKLLVDTILFVKRSCCIKRLTNNIRQINGDWEKFLTTQKAAVIAKKLGIKKASLTQSVATSYINAKLISGRDKLSRLHRSLRADAAALIPLAGAHLSWRIGTGYEGKSFRPLFTRAITQAVEHHHKPLSRIMFIRSGQKAHPDPRGFKIPVQTSTKTRFIEVFFCRHNHERAVSEVPTVVLFTGNGDTGFNMLDTGRKHYLNKGYNILTVTIGGYPGSPGVRTSEASCYQDIEAVKVFLRGMGVTQVAYHGLSLGGALAFQAAAGETNVHLETLFVVAAQTFTSTKDVAGNILGAPARGVMAAAIPAGRLVELPGNKWIRTDGMNNLTKAEALRKKNIPLFCIKASQDRLMGRGRDYVNNVFKKNFADDLYAARYPEGEQLDKEDHLIAVHGGHCADITAIALNKIPSLLGVA